MTASDTESTPKTATTTVTITVSPPALKITTGSLPNGTLRTAYSATVAATGGTGHRYVVGQRAPRRADDELGGDDQRHAERVGHASASP